MTRSMTLIRPDLGLDVVTDETYTLGPVINATSQEGPLVNFYNDEGKVMGTITEKGLAHTALSLLPHKASGPRDHARAAYACHLLCA